MESNTASFSAWGWALPYNKFGNAVIKFELIPLKRLIRALLLLNVTFKRYQLKRNRLDYELLFRKRSGASRPDSREGHESMFFYSVISSSVP